MDIRKTRTCEKCKAVVTLDKVRLVPKDKDTNSLVCEDCCNAIKNKTAKTPITNTQPVKNTLGEVKLLSCSRCNYSFRIDTIKAGTLHKVFCPYCGKADRLENYSSKARMDTTNATVTKQSNPISKLYK
ncbi:hypothetical protein COY27_05530 [Candidatus Woesearchaeota archaeon CG_4_10_14_0_2_um_filter_33_13]|nr:MAG: hypothetical protein COY27_05530 [Candidatus Woesearchaeota archaeon CG_4_10_14_0_2_um_filter_33_13]